MGWCPTALLTRGPSRPGESRPLPPRARSPPLQRGLVPGRPVREPQAVFARRRQVPGRDGRRLVAVAPAPSIVPAVAAPAAVVAIPAVPVPPIPTALAPIGNRPARATFPGVRPALTLTAVVWTSVRSGGVGQARDHHGRRESVPLAAGGEAQDRQRGAAVLREGGYPVHRSHVRDSRDLNGQEVKDSRFPALGEVAIPSAAGRVSGLLDEG